MEELIHAPLSHMLPLKFSHIVIFVLIFRSTLSYKFLKGIMDHIEKLGGKYNNGNNQNCRG